MILCGPPGVGKTRLIQLLIDNLLGANQNEAVLQFQSSDERTNQIIREKIHQFVPKKVQTSSPKLVVFRQAEQLSEGVQQIMRRLMECHYHHAVFIFVCSRLNGILETLQSRCHIFRFSPVDIPDQVVYLRRISLAEKITPDEAALELIAKISNGDMRASINYLQAACCTLKDNNEDEKDQKTKQLTVPIVQSVCLFPHYKHLTLLFNLFISASDKDQHSTHTLLEGFHKCLDIVLTLYDQGYSGRDIVMFLSNYLMTTSEQMPRRLHLVFVKNVALCHQRMAKGVDSYAQLAGLVAALYRESIQFRSAQISST